MKEYFYDLDLDWKSNGSGSISSYGLNSIEVDTRSGLGSGRKTKWTSEHFLGAAVASYLMNSFISLADASDVAIASYHCQCFIKLEKDNQKFSPMEILVRPSIKLINERDKPKAYNLMEKAEADCSIKKMININIKVLPQIDSL